MLEVVCHDQATATYIIPAGTGEHADWFRNIQKTPHVLVQSGGQRWEAVAERLPLNAAAEELCGYAQRHPYAVRVLSHFLLGETLADNLETCHRLAERVPLVAVHPDS